MSQAPPIAADDAPAHGDAGGLANGEAALLASARDYAPLARLEDCSLEAMRGLTALRGVDFATAVLFDRLSRSERHRAFIERIDARRAGQREAANATDATLVIVPGALYMEHPHLGGGGDLLRAAGEPMGYRVEVIPLPNTASLDVNAGIINAHLRAHTGGRVVLASLSKGSADVKAALLRDDAGEAFSRVTDWLDFSGISHGTPLATRFMKSIPLWMIGRLWFWWRGYDWQMMRDLADDRPNVLSGPARVPPHVRTMHLLGFPLTAHVSTPMARRHHRRLRALGPNDGCGLLARAGNLPGAVYPLWGADHYLRPGPPERMRALAAAILSEAAERA